jgi:hypothetical protein
MQCRIMLPHELDAGSERFNIFSLRKHIHRMEDLQSDKRILTGKSDSLIAKHWRPNY